MTISSLLTMPRILPPALDDTDMPPPRSQNDFLFLIRAFFVSGGTARQAELDRLLQEHAGAGTWGQQLSTWIATKKILAFEWHQTIWIPMFQFDLSDLSIKLPAQQVRAELDPFISSGWAQAWWLGQPHARLDHHRPVDMLDLNLPAVLAAARSDRLMAELGKPHLACLPAQRAKSSSLSPADRGSGRRTAIAQLLARGHG